MFAVKDGQVSDAQALNRVFWLGAVYVEFDPAAYHGIRQLLLGSGRGFERGDKFTFSQDNHAVGDFFYLV